MASRCIKALNDLEDISDKVFYKYSKNRFRSEIEGRIKASKSKVDRSFVQNFPPKAEKRRGSTGSFSLNSKETTSPNTSGKARGSKSAANPEIPNTQIKEQKERPKSTSYCRNRAHKTLLKKNEQKNEEMKEKSSLKAVGKTPSVYGKHNQDEERSSTESWFNFDDGMKMGSIDSFVCDDRNRKALCYGLDKKEAKPVPKLLRHRLEVRIGQNGEVRDENGGINKKDSKDTGDNMCKKIPLSWEEQLNWENACIKSPRSPSQQKTEDQSLCETHPVIFHPQESPTTLSSSSCDICDTTAAYRMFLERRLLVSDRGNLMYGGKCITSVEIEDARDEIKEKKELNMINTSLKAYVMNDDRMDMGATIRNIQNIYPRRSAASKSSLMYNSENVVANTEPSEFNQVEHIDEVSDRDNTQSIDSERMDNINKRVSFKDQTDLTGKFDGLGVQDKNAEAVQDANMPISLSKVRPRSSKERTEVLADVKKKPKRPYTAPPCSPRLTQDEDFEKEIARHFNLAPIRVPTSQVNSSDQDKINENPLPDNGENLTLDNELNDISIKDTNESLPAMRVSVACKSAPMHGGRTQTPEEHITRSFSSMSTQTNKSKYVPTQPVAVLADSSLELPPNLPPAKALVELRKKIREDLAKETADLQLDIQQLYLKHHASS